MVVGVDDGGQPGGHALVGFAQGADRCGRRDRGFLGAGCRATSPRHRHGILLLRLRALQRDDQRIQLLHGGAGRRHSDGRPRAVAALQRDSRPWWSHPAGCTGSSTAQRPRRRAIACSARQSAEVPRWWSTAAWARRGPARRWRSTARMFTGTCPWPAAGCGASPTLATAVRDVAVGVNNPREGLALDEEYLY